MSVATLILILIGLLSPINTQNCRDRTKWPFASSSIWNMPIGSKAEYSRADIFSNIKPLNFFSDDDYFFVVNTTDSLTPWYNQGWWGNPSGRAHCDIKGPLVGHLYFNRNTIVQAFGNNNGAAILQPDRVTLVQLQPFYRCDVGSPILGLYGLKNESILEDGLYGAHGGSGLSALGGTIRLGELLPSAGPIRHALKLELYAHDYYYKGNPCYRWPAKQCDGYHNDNNSPLEYGGDNPLLTPGALLAVPPSKQPQVSTVPGKMILEALTYYGGYLVDDTAWNRGTICTEHGVTDEFMKTYGYPFNTSNGPFYNDLLAIFKALEIVSNNSPNSVGGGGEPLRPVAPPICN